MFAACVSSKAMKTRRRKRGDVGEIKVLISHPMKRGFRPGPDGKFFPRDTLKSFACTYDGEHVFSAELFPAVSANP